MAFQADISPDVFWTMTPWQVGLCLDVYTEKQKNYHQSQRFGMWHIAMLSRIKKMPPLKEFVTGEKNSVLAINETDIMARMKMHNTKLKDKQDGSQS